MRASASVASPVQLGSVVYSVGFSRDNSLTINRKRFNNLRKAGYADSTVLSKTKLFKLNYVLLKTKKGTLPFPLTEILGEKTFVDKVTCFIESGAIYFVISKINYGYGVVGRNRGENENHETEVFTAN